MKIDRIHVYDHAIKILKHDLAINDHSKFSQSPMNAFNELWLNLRTVLSSQSHALTSDYKSPENAPLIY